MCGKKLAKLSVFLLFLMLVPFFTLRNTFCVGIADSPKAVKAKAECVIEVNSKRILYADNSDVRLPMASTTKILTCITVLELCPNLSATMQIPDKAVGIEGSSVYLKAGDTYTVEELLYGLMLRSGNDCAVALALHCSKSVPAFAAQMNYVAQKAGALSSHFVNPHGLPAKGHYTTAKDLGFITCYAMQNPIFREIVSTKFYETRQWKNKNKMLGLYDGAIGVKTGYTKEAGRCLVSAAKRGDMTLVCVVLNCPTTYERSSRLLNDAFAAYSYLPLVAKNAEIVLEDGKEKGRVAETFRYPVRKEELDLLEIRTRKISSPRQEIIGHFQIYIGKWLLFSGNLYKL